jgi:Peptidase family M28
VDAAGRLELIEKLCSFEGRGPGTDAERRAANWLAGRLRKMGRRAEIEPTYVHPEYSLAIALHVALAIAGSLLALLFPAVGFALVLFAAFSLYGDQTTRYYLLRRLLFRRASQNIVSPGRRPGAPARLVLSAHYDAAKTGYVFSARSVRLAHRLSERARVMLGPIRLIFWAVVVPLLLLTGLRMAGIEGAWISIAQLAVIAIGLLTLALLIDIALSEIVPGACDNASAVAAVLSVAELLGTEPPGNLDVWVVLPGAEECNAEGMACYMRAHRRELDRERTYFVNLDSVSYGDVHFQRSEGAIANQAMDRQLVELCEEIADRHRSGEGDDGHPPRPVRHPFHTDALPAVVRGFRAISIVGAEDGVGPPYYHTPEDKPANVDAASIERAVEFTLELVRAIDRGLSSAGKGNSNTEHEASAPTSSATGAGHRV